MKPKYLLLFLFIALLIGGGFLLFSAPKDASSGIVIGESLKVDTVNSSLILLSNLDTLATDGLYYAAWGTGEKEPYENSNGKTTELYDAQIYLLLGECKNGSMAQDNMDAWLAAAKSNYEVISETEAVYNGQTYTKLIYRFKNTNSPHTDGISVFTVTGGSAVCIELVCREHFQEYLESILSDFLKRCSYITE